MTVLFFSRRFYPQIGGVEKHVMEVGKRMVNRGFRVIVITEMLGVDNKEEVINGIEVRRIRVGRDSKRKKYKVWVELWKMRNFIQSADVIHCHDIFFWYLPFRFLYPKKPVYTTFHGYESYPISRKAVIIRKLSEKLSWGNICIGDFIKKWYHTKPNFVSYGGVELATKKENKNKKKESAVFIGRLDEQTGILTYIKAWEIIKKKFPNFDLLVVGDGEYRNMIHKKTKVTGFQENSEKYLQNYHYAFVSRYLSILEAFAAKKLVFAVYDNPVKEDYLKLAPFAKFIVIESLPERIAEKVAFYLDYPEDEKILVDKAYNWMKDQTWDKMVETYLKLWKNA